MATTVNDVFQKTMDLIDERLETGLIDPSSTVIYEKRTPGLLTMLQDELIRDSDYYKTHTITKAVTSNAGNWQSYDMPTDFYNAEQIITIETQGDYTLASDLKWEQHNKLLVPDAFEGTIKVVYYPIPAPLTLMTDTLLLDDITCRSVLTYGLANRLLSNENVGLANYFADLYDSAKARMKPRNTLFETDIIDNYDSGLNF